MITARLLTRAAVLSAVIVFGGSGVAFTPVLSSGLASARGVSAAGRGVASPGRAVAPRTPYSLVNTCQAIQTRPAGRPLEATAGPYRMQAAALAVYLLYGVHQDFLGDRGAGALASMATASAATEWQLTGDSARGFTIRNLGTGTVIPVSFKATSGCAVYPETQVDATGTPFKGSAPTGWVNGTIDAHVHVTGFELFGGEWHCGRPWDAFGAPAALPDCKGVQQGTNGQVESFLDYGTPAHAHDTVGWPTFHAWPSPTDLGEEGTYYTGMKRAWMAGLRVMVTQLVENEALCTLMSQRRNPCNDMASVRIQAQDLRQLQDYIDAQSGGPGKGFFRIVTNPFQARQVVNSGKLAVVEGVEVSHVLNCGEYLGTPQCTQAQVDSGLAELHRLGVSTFFPIHKFDNAFGGTKMDGGTIGVIVNHGNHLETGHYWSIETCKGPAHDSQQSTIAPLGGAATLINGPVAAALGGGPLPAYPPPPHCNTRGLTSLGTYLLDKMIQQHFIVELDHMDVKTADATLSVLEAHHYSGVVSAHSWDSPQENPRIYNLGGFVTPIAGSSPASFIDYWRTTRTIRNTKFYSGTGFGYGADMNGLAEQSQPAGTGGGHQIGYPFQSFDGRVTFGREVWGQRAFDLNKDGVANYGMYADWLQELRLMAGPALMDDMFHGGEAYLEMWERAYGVPYTNCRSSTGNFTATGTRVLRLGASSESLLYALGQPSSRPGRSYRYCVDRSPKGSIAAVFTSRGTAGLFTSTSRGYGGAFGIHPGSSARRLRGHATPFASGVWVGQRLRRGARLIYGVSHGRVRFVGVAARSEFISRAVLRSDLRAAGVA